VHRQDQNEVRPCKNCPNQVVLDDRGIWKHTGHVGYSCRDADNVILPTYAEPVRTDPAVLVSPYRPTGRAHVERNW